MKKLLTWLLIIGILFWYTSATTTYVSKTENWHAYKVFKVVLDGKSKIVVGVAPNDSLAKSLKTLMDEMWWTHAINWGFFCPSDYAYCGAFGYSDWLRKSNWILYSNFSEDVGDNKSVFGFNQSGWVAPMAFKEPRTRISQWVRQNDAVDKIYNGMMMPTLVKDGVNVAVLNDDMNNNPKQGAVNNKTFICSTQDNSTIYMWFVDGVTFSSVADYIIDTFGCYNAILLDNGSTKAMVYNNNYVAWPWRAMRDAFIIIEGDWWAVVNQTEATISYTTEELQTAITWMYNQGLTMYSTIDDFLPNNTMTREEASKFFSVFAKTIFNKSESTSFSCGFKDLTKADSTLRESISSSCRLGIFKWYKGYFSPFDKLTNAQAITVLMRIMVWTLEEPTNVYYTNYLLKAKEFGLISNIDTNAPIKRWDAAILIYKAYLNNSQNNTTITDVENIVDITPSTNYDISNSNNNTIEQTTIQTNNIIEEEVNSENILHKFEIYKDYEENHLTFLNEYRESKWIKKLILSEELSTCAKDYAKELLKIWWYSIPHNLNWTTPISRCGGIFNSPIVEENLLLIWHGMVDGDEALDWRKNNVSCETRQINNDFWRIGIASVWDHTIQKGIRIQVLVP